MTSLSIPHLAFSIVRWHYRDPLLVWLFPAFYACHILEEWFGGFPEWVGSVFGAPLPRLAFVIINAAAMVAMVAATRATARDERHGWMGIAIATVTLINAIIHILGSLVVGTYSPGLFTGVILYLPLAQLALLRAWHQAERTAVQRGIVAGVALHALVILVAVTATRWGRD